MSSSRILRFSYYERVVHWVVAFSFIYLMLTGLALWSPRLYWLAAVMGGGETVRAWHPWAGVVFSVAFGLMFVKWLRQMLLDKDDRKWLRMAHRYARHQAEGLPEAGRYNAGQKMMFWMQGLLCVILLLSGLVLWWPESMSRGLRLASIVVHSAAAVLSIAGLIVHFYMATFATPGSLRSMILGWVTPEWAKTHHPKWYQEDSDGPSTR